MRRSILTAQTLTRDGALGAAGGLLIACLYLAASVDLRQMAASGAPLETLTTLIAAAVAEGAAAAALGGFWLRRYAAGTD